MKQRYVIKGTQRIGERVRLILSPEEVVEEREDVGIMKMAGNIMGTLNKMKEDAIFSQHPDTITISFDEWNQRKYKIGDVVKINLEPEL